MARNLVPDSFLTRTEFETEENVPYRIPITSCRVHDAMDTVLPNAAAADDMGLITGTPGTNALLLQSVDFGGTTSDEKCAFEFVLPAEYQAGESITVKIRAGAITTLPDTSSTIDVECWPVAADGTVGADICATAAQSIRSLTMADKSFVITSTGLVAGDLLIIRLSFAGSDTGNLGVMALQINRIDVLLDVRG